MRKYLLDTNICVFLLQNKYGVSQRIEEIGRENCYISEISIAELLYGAACSINREKHLKEVDQVINLFTVLPIYQGLPFFAEIKAKLRKQGQVLDNFDLLIGASAIANGLILVTDNEKHFKRIEGVQIENWIKRK